MLVDLARALKLSADELLGLTPLRDTPSPKIARLLERMERLAELPDAEQRAVLKVVDGFLDRTAGRSPAGVRPRRRGRNAKQAESRAAKEKPGRSTGRASCIRSAACRYGHRSVAIPATP